MENFYYYNPTKIIFKKGGHKDVGSEIEPYGKKVLLHYSGDSIKIGGLYDDIILSLAEKGLQVVELPGVVSNPRLSLIREGIKLCKEEEIDFILGIGGGSAIDSTKAIAAGVKSDEDIWDKIVSGSKFTDALPYGIILTLPGTGSEMNNICIVSNEDTKQKLGISLVHPKFSILNAELCATAPKMHRGFGIFDMFTHMVEMYFTPSTNVEVVDRMLEANMKTVYNLSLEVYENPHDYDKYSQIMWAGTIAHNYSLAVGRQSDWSSHQIEHEVSGIFDIPHAQGLAFIMPSWMRYVYKTDIARFARFADKVFNVEVDFFDLDKTALLGIRLFEEWIEKLGMSTKENSGLLDNDSIEQIANVLTKNNTISIGRFQKLSKDDIEHILKK